jgi:hypothetical protein
MPVFSKAIRAICSFAVATAIISACPAHGKEADCQGHDGTIGAFRLLARPYHVRRGPRPFRQGCLGAARLSRPGAGACAQRAYVVPATA